MFTGTAYRGNPLAVVLDASELDTGEMQHFTDWTNLSEATFLLKPSDARADYQVRIFCPGRELPFAGHPTLGSCHAWLRAGGRPRGNLIIQECGIGLVSIRQQDGKLWFTAPPVRRSGPLEESELDIIVRGLGLERTDVVAHSWCRNGPLWQAVLLRSVEKLHALHPDSSVLESRDVGAIAPCPAGSDCAFEVRAFFPKDGGTVEDPVTGSLNAGLACWMIGAGLAPARYTVCQGTALARAGRVHVERDAEGTIWIGGESVTCIEGTVLL